MRTVYHKATPLGLFAVGENGTGVSVSEYTWSAMCSTADAKVKVTTFVQER